MSYSSRINGIKSEDGTYTGEYYDEDGQRWYRIIDSDNQEFETSEEPVEIINLGLLRFTEGASEEFVRQVTN